ncbi:ketoacyl-ACP synthase III [Oligoflexia bacterium]|nr:ketoacyl-ACP synthase III [Oligoflexia bacterium]
MVQILGMGYAHPDILMDNKFIEDLDIGTSQEWIIEKIGIKSRLISLPLDYIRETKNEDPEAARAVATTTPVALGTEACRMAIDQAGLKVEDIGLILCNCSAANETIPAVAQSVARSLGLNVVAYDVHTACPAFALHLNFIDNFKDEALPDYVLCLSTAALSQHVNFSDRSDAAIWGDGAAAWIVSTRHKGKLKLIDSLYTTDPLRCDAVVIDTYGHFHQDGRAVRDFSVRQTVRLIRKIEQEHDIDWNRDIFIGHQANKTMLEQITNNRKIPPTNHWHNVTEIGNQAGAGCPATLAMNWDKVVSGQKIVIAVVGAGLSWGSAVFEVQ